MSLKEEKGSLEIQQNIIFQLHTSTMLFKCLVNP